MEPLAELLCPMLVLIPDPDLWITTQRCDAALFIEWRTLRGLYEKEHGKLYSDDNAVQLWSVVCANGHTVLRGPTDQETHSPPQAVQIQKWLAELSEKMLSRSSGEA